jgi:hypothetical protein
VIAPTVKILRCCYLQMKGTKNLERPAVRRIRPWRVLSPEYTARGELLSPREEPSPLALSPQARSMLEKTPAKEDSR